jgi:hypothetical protein
MHGKTTIKKKGVRCFWRCLWRVLYLGVWHRVVWCDVAKVMNEPAVSISVCFLPWGWRQVAPKYWYLSGLYGVTFQNTAILIMLDGIPSCFPPVCFSIVNITIETKLCVVGNYRHLQQGGSYSRLVTFSACWSVLLFLGRPLFLLLVGMYSYINCGMRVSLVLILSLVHTLYTVSPNQLTK